MRTTDMPTNGTSDRYQPPPSIASLTLAPTERAAWIARSSRYKGDVGGFRPHREHASTIPCCEQTSYSPYEKLVPCPVGVPGSPQVCAGEPQSPVDRRSRSTRRLASAMRPPGRLASAVVTLGVPAACSIRDWPVGDVRHSPTAARGAPSATTRVLSGARRLRGLTGPEAVPEEQNAPELGRERRRGTHYFSQARCPGQTLTAPVIPPGCGQRGAATACWGQALSLCGTRPENDQAMVQLIADRRPRFAQG